MTRLCETLVPSDDPDNTLCGQPAEFLAFYRDDDTLGCHYFDSDPVAICRRCSDTDDDILLCCWPLIQE